MTGASFPQVDHLRKTAFRQVTHTKYPIAIPQLRLGHTKVSKIQFCDCSWEIGSELDCLVRVSHKLPWIIARRVMIVRGRQAYDNTRSDNLPSSPHSDSEPTPLVRIVPDEVLKVDHDSIRVLGDVSWETPIPCHRDLLANDKIKPSLIVPDQVNG